MTPLGLARAMVGTAHAAACVFFTVGYISTGSWVLAGVACVSAAFAYWLLDDGE